MHNDDCWDLAMTLFHILDECMVPGGSWSDMTDGECETEEEVLEMIYWDIQGDISWVESFLHQYEDVSGVLGLVNRARRIMAKME